MINVLSVTSECVPFVKTGGLADVAGALPGALAAEDVHMRTLLPGYPQVMEHLDGVAEITHLSDVFGETARLLASEVDGVDLLVLDVPHLFDRGAGIYLDETGHDWPDSIERFAALCQVAAQICDGLLPDWAPHILHSHDWQGGLAPYYLSKTSAAERVKSVITVHNIAFQGLAPADKLGELGIDERDYTPDGVEYFGQISTLKAGLVWADKITTVSPTYAQELMTQKFGMGLDGVLRSRRDDLIGILNGIDHDVWNPETDENIRTYKTLKGKAANKKALQEEFNLPQSEGPLCVVVSRLTGQKGLDLLLDALPTLTARGGQLILLGSGEPGLEQAYKQISVSENIAVHIGYDEAMSHRLIAGGDAILVPSRFEPCGLTQLYGLRYGTLPVVALTGGLADTVIPANAAAVTRGVATGVQFSPITADGLRNAISTLCDLYDAPKVWAKMQRNAMAQPVGWGDSAAKYANLYADLLKGTE